MTHLFARRAGKHEFRANCTSCLISRHTVIRSPEAACMIAALEVVALLPSFIGDNLPPELAPYLSRQAWFRWLCGIHVDRDGDGCVTVRRGSHIYYLDLPPRKDTTLRDRALRGY